MLTHASIFRIFHLFDNVKKGEKSVCLNEFFLSRDHIDRGRNISFDIGWHTRLFCHHQKGGECDFPLKI